MYAIPYILSAVGGAGQLQGIQTGTATITNTNSSTTAVIAALSNINKGFLIFQYDSQQDWDDADECMISGQISSTTQLTFARSGNTGQINIRWWVVEFKASSSVTVQRGARTFTGATENVSISSVNLSNAFPIISYRTPDNDLDQDHFITADLTSTTNLRLQAYASRSQVVEWQIIENPSWTVAKYTGTLTGTTLNTTITAVTLANAWLISTGRFAASVSIGGDSIARCGFTSTTNIQAVRNSSPCNAPMVYFVVSHANIQAQHVQYSIGSGSTSNTQAVSSITTSNSFIKQTGMNMCHALNTNSGNQGGRLCIRHSINSATQIQANRQVGTEIANFNAEVLDFTNV